MDLLPWTFIFFMCLVDCLKNLLINFAWIFNYWLEVIELVFELLIGYWCVILFIFVNKCFNYLCRVYPDLFVLKWAILQLWHWGCFQIRIIFFITLGLLGLWIRVSKSQNITASFARMVKFRNSFWYLVWSFIDWNP